jgi:hypothetical protein
MAGAFPSAAGPAGGFPGAGTTAAPQVAPAVQALVTRINARVDSAIAAGQPQDAVLSWFRQQCGPDAAQATMDQIKSQFLYRLNEAQLADIAKLMQA